jgi:hypothetical protein
MGYMKSAGVRVVSRTMRRSPALWRSRRGRAVRKIVVFCMGFSSEVITGMVVLIIERVNCVKAEKRNSA